MPLQMVLEFALNEVYMGVEIRFYGVCSSVSIAVVAA